ncbi:MAG: ATP-binding protein [Sandaracinaceae bacterium]
MTDGNDEPAFRRSVSEMLALVVHDLRNPVATISANVSFVREEGAEALQGDSDLVEALDDVDLAMNDLMRGLEQLAWIARWIGGSKPVEAAGGDVRQAVESALHRIEKTVPVTYADVLGETKYGGAPLSRTVELLVRNSLQHDARGTPRVDVRREEDVVIIEVRDAGRAVGADLREHVFDLDGQQVIKSRPDGRYSRALGLLAARALADGLHATLEAGGTDGDAWFRLRVPAR